MSIPRLVPIRTQAFYWISSASVVAIRQGFDWAVTKHNLAAPGILAAVVLCLLATRILDRPDRPWWTVRSSYVFVVGFLMLLTSELLVPWRQLDYSNQPPPTQPYTTRQNLAIRFCFAYYVVHLMNGYYTPGSRIAVPDDGLGATFWCQLPILNEICGHPVLERNDKLRGACHAALPFSISYALSRTVAYFLLVRWSPYVGLCFMGCGCLGSLNPTIQMLFLMQPIYTLALWLCNEILYRLAKLKQNKALF